MRKKKGKVKEDKYLLQGVVADNVYILSVVGEQVPYRIVINGNKFIMKVHEHIEGNNNSPLVHIFPPPQIKNKKGRIYE